MDLYLKYNEIIVEQKKNIDLLFGNIWKNMDQRFLTLLKDPWNIKVYNYFKKYNNIPDTPAFYKDIPKNLGDFKDVREVILYMGQHINQITTTIADKEMYFYDTYNEKLSNFLGNYYEKIEGIKMTLSFDVIPPESCLIGKFLKNTAFFVLPESYIFIFINGEYTGKKTSDGYYNIIYNGMLK